MLTLVTPPDDTERFYNLIISQFNHRGRPCNIMSDDRRRVRLALDLSKAKIRRDCVKFLFNTGFNQLITLIFVSTLLCLMSCVLLLCKLLKAGWSNDN